MRTALLLLVLFCVRAIAWGWYMPADITRNVTSAEFLHDLGVFVNATRLSYTQTYGGYYEPWTVNESISSAWTKSTLEVNPPFGMRALAFFQRSTWRVLVVYRGTDLTNTTSGICDQCADRMLWGGVAYRDLPDPCHRFDESTLDYFRAALLFARRVALHFFGYDMMFTGHSLGAGLAALVSNLGNIFLDDCAPPNRGAVVFSTPGYVEVLINNTGADLGDVDPRRLVVFADEWDPVFVGCNRSKDGGFLGYWCTWSDGPPSQSCITCDSTTGELPRDTSACNACMQERHVFSHYMAIARVSPTCHGSRQECTALFSCPTKGPYCWGR
jgi:hypothetical protein